MALTAAQNTALKAAIIADGTLNAKPNNSDGNTDIANAMNLPASPAWTAWKTNVSISEIGDSFSGTELAGLTTGNQTRLQTIAQYSPDGINPSLADRRAFFDDVFSGAGGNITRPRLLTLYKRLATRVQKLFSTGTGSDAAPATLAANISQDFVLTYQDVETARNS